MKDSSQYVIAADGGIINIASIDPKNRYAYGPYHCVACGDLMVPALGRTRRHHFKHKAGRSIYCTEETYLHKLGKMMLMKALSDAVKYQKPFPLIRRKSIVCNRYSSSLGIFCTHQNKLHADNLASRFDTVEEEQSISGFRADILLASKQTNENTLIEIAVSHESEQQKIDSGLSIIEIIIKSEADIERFKNGIDATFPNVRIYNFPPLDASHEQCENPCDLDCVIFLLYVDGKIWFTETSTKQLHTLTNDPRLLEWAVMKSEPKQTRLDAFKIFILKQTFHNNQNVKSCLICQHNGGQTSKHDIHCNSLGRNVWMSSHAISCDSFYPVANEEDAKTLLNENLHTLPSY